MKPKHLKPEMALAVLEDRKKQTRMPVPGLEGEWIYSGPNCNGDHLFVATDWQQRKIDVSDCTVIRKPKYKIGDVLYIRERARLIDVKNGGEFCEDSTVKWLVRYKYEADGIETDWIYKPRRIKHHEVGTCCSNGCFRELARIFVKITGVRVEWSEDMTEADCIAEGVRKVSKDAEIYKYCIYDHGDYSSVPWCDMPRSPRPVFDKMWDSCYPKLKGKPHWRFVFDFKRIAKP
jgi:hypothetical protein